MQNQAAILVTPMGEIRQASGSYEGQAKRQGLTLSLRPQPTHGLSASEKDGSGPLAPGFTE